MVLGNYKIFLPKHVTGIKFGSTIWSDTQMTTTATALDTSFATNNATALIDLAGTADTNNPTKSYAFAKDINTSGNERGSNAEGLLGSLDGVSQNTEIITEFTSPTTVEATVVYRNPQVTAIFNDSTKCCLMTMDNSESATTGVVNLAFNNIVVNHVGSLSRGNTGMMEQKVKFTCRGGLAAAVKTISQGTPAETWARINVGLDYAEEVRTA